MDRLRFANINCSDPAGRQVSNPAGLEARVPRSLFRILGDNALCSIATITLENRAHINTAYFCYSDELELYFLSHPASLHCRNLSANSFTAVAVFSSEQKWGAPDRGVQLFGTCREAKGAQSRKAEQFYGGRFPGYANWKAALKPGDMGADYRLYRFLTRRCKILDEEEFGGGVFVSAAIIRDRRTGRSIRSA